MSTITTGCIGHKFLFLGDFLPFVGCFGCLISFCGGVLCKVYPYCLHAWDPVILCRSYVCTQQIHWIYFEAFIAETYVQLAATGANVLRTRTLCCYCSAGNTTNNNLQRLSCTVLCGALYTACVDASRTEFLTVQSSVSRGKL